MRSFILSSLALLGLAAGFPTLIQTAQADGVATRSDILPTEQIKKGMKGYGLTVFEGTVPSKFNVEVIDILKNFRPRQDLVLIKTDHPRLDVAKIVAGMSGSPIYLQGKMVGAYAYGWTFSEEPIAGVTPIRNMLDDLERPLPHSIHGIPFQQSPAKRHARANESDGTLRFSGDLENYSSFGHAHQLAQAHQQKMNLGSSEATPTSTPLLLGGMSAGALSAAQDLLRPLGLEPLQAGGTSARHSKASTDAQFVDGGSIGVNLINGDMSAMGLGTVTRVEEDGVLGFGHPMMNLGITNLPTSTARVLWFMASKMRSFKMGEAIARHGALVNDRQASIVVREDLEAPVIPVHLAIEGEPGAPTTDWNFEVAHDRFLSPSFLGMAIGSGLQSAAAERRDVTYVLETRIKFEGYPDVYFKDFGSMPTGTPQVPQIMESLAFKGLGAVFNNPWTPIRVESVDVKVKLQFKREVALLLGIDLLTPEVEAGESARIRVHFNPYDAPQESRIFSIPIPEDSAGKVLTYKVAPGYSVRREKGSSTTLDELISNLENPTLKARSLVVSTNSTRGGATYKNIVAEDLPLGFLDTMAATTSSRGPAEFLPAKHQVEPLPYFVVGTDSFTVQVKE
ncbi:MAG: hypothetical protein MK135_05130 [Polyangiaceae bacterium]|nr:hypothetical protein [Polyangiaceae bacterium]